MDAKKVKESPTRPKNVMYIIYYFVAFYAVNFLLSLGGVLIFGGDEFGYQLFLSVITAAIGLTIIYESLWKMNREWVQVLMFFSALAILYIIFALTVVIDILLVVHLGALAIILYHLFENMNTYFPKTDTKKSAVGDKSEWIRLGIILIGWVIGVFVVLQMPLFEENFNLIIASFILWPIIVWFGYPRIVR